MRYDKWIILVLGSFSFLVLPVVQADVEPNDSPAIAERVGPGTHTGSISYTDYNDYYKVDVKKDTIVLIDGEMTSSSTYDTITILSCNMNGMPDDQVGIFLNHDNKTDGCSWENDGGYDTTMYLQIYGQGNYEIKISTMSTSNNDDSFCGGTFVLFLAPLTIAVAVLIFVKKMRRD